MERKSGKRGRETTQNTNQNSNQSQQNIKEESELPQFGSLEKKQKLEKNKVDQIEDEKSDKMGHQPQSFFLSLPVFLIRKIVINLPPKTAFRLAKVCKRLRLIMEDETTCESFCIKWWKEHDYHLHWMPLEQLSECIPSGKDWRWLVKNFSHQTTPVAPTAVSASFIYEGSGICIYKDHGRYVGNFDTNSIRNGFGVYYWPSGRKYEGEWKMGSMQGYGIETSNEGQYIGEWRDGLYHGNGVYTWTSDGQIYDGQWEVGKTSGSGSDIWPDGTKYVGEIKNCKYNGKGTYSWPDGRSFEGTWKDGLKDGLGTYSWPSGTVYTGEYKDDKLHGKGTIVWPTGFAASGQFVQNFPVDENAFLHPDIKKTIQENKCTSVVTKDFKRYGQILWECKMCAKDTAGERCFCESCRDCHLKEYPEHTFHKRWVVCVFNCYCYSHPDKCLHDSFHLSSN